MRLPLAFVWLLAKAVAAEPQPTMDHALGLIDALADAVSTLHAQLQIATPAVAGDGAEGAASDPAVALDTLWGPAEQAKLKRWIESQHTVNPKVLVDQAREFKQRVIDSKKAVVDAVEAKLEEKVQKAKDAAKSAIQANLTSPDEAFEQMQQQLAHARKWAKSKMDAIPDLLSNLTNTTLVPASAPASDDAAPVDSSSASASASSSPSSTSDDDAISDDSDDVASSGPSDDDHHSDSDSDDSDSDSDSGSDSKMPRLASAARKRAPHSGPRARFLANRAWLGLAAVGAAIVFAIPAVLVHRRRSRHDDAYVSVGEAKRGRGDVRAGREAEGLTAAMLEAERLASI
jgi:biopolymer transport protein ExbB/TolQ